MLVPEDVGTQAATLYWVVGGEYADTSFGKPAAGKRLERIGPFRTQEEAHKVWQGKAWSTVDDALCHYRIEIETHVEGE